MPRTKKRCAAKNSSTHGMEAMMAAATIQGAVEVVCELGKDFAGLTCGSAVGRADHGAQRGELGIQADRVRVTQAR